LLWSPCRLLVRLVVERAPKAREEAASRKPIVAVVCAGFGGAVGRRALMRAVRVGL
jgi:hypothetical protein